MTESRRSRKLKRERKALIRKWIEDRHGEPTHVRGPGITIPHFIRRHRVENQIQELRYAYQQWRARRDSEGDTA